MKNLVIFAVVVLGAFLAWQNVPGLRTATKNAINDLNGWSEEDRAKDPVGFIEHAMKQLGNDIESFKAAEGNLDAVKAEQDAKLAEYDKEVADATAVASTFKELFKTAEETGNWPVTTLGKDYTKDELIDQVNDLLTTKQRSGDLADQYRANIKKIAAQRSELKARIDESQFAIANLEAKKGTVEVGKLTEDTDKMLAQVNDIVEGNTKSEGAVRSLEDLMKEGAKQAKAEAKEAAENLSDKAALDFLNG